MSLLTELPNRPSQYVKEPTTWNVASMVNLRQDFRRRPSGYDGQAGVAGICLPLADSGLWRLDSVVRTFSHSLKKSLVRDYL
jgi:hypothetical protein